MLTSKFWVKIEKEIIIPYSWDYKDLPIASTYAITNFLSNHTIVSTHPIKWWQLSFKKATPEFLPTDLYYQFDIFFFPPFPLQNSLHEQDSETL